MGRETGDGSEGEPATVRRHLIVEGRVQGVGYRASCTSQAQRIGVSGHVANLADGTVEVVIEGGPADVEALVDWCRSGPRHADVRDIRVTEAPAEGIDGFHATG